MNCSKCGRKLDPTERFCIVCGSRINNGISNDVNYDISQNGIDFMVRRYFFGFGDIFWFSIIGWVVSGFLKNLFGIDRWTREVNAFGTVCVIGQFAAIIGIFAAIFLNIYIRGQDRGKDNVDRAVEVSVRKLKARAQNKFNVDNDQISEIEPIIVAGAGDSPVGLIKQVFIEKMRFTGLGRLYSKEPVEAYRVGKDKVPRYLLVQTTVYAFTDTQLLVYTGNIDISTGIIYDEKVSEVFYKDINSVTQRDILKKFKMGIFKKEYYSLKYMVLDICGISKIASFDSRITANASISLAGMESYIREKKN